MRVLKRLLAGFAGLVVLLVLVAYLLPRVVTVERSVGIAAPPETIFLHINSLQATRLWSPWLDRDPDVKLAYSGPEAGVGNRMDWTSDHPQVGDGSQEITASLPHARVETALEFGPSGQGKAWTVLAEAKGGTRVTWGFETDMGANPLGRWMGLMFVRWLGPDYEAGLTRL